ncbi:MAG: EamA family transporter RarD [Peptococcaceae bacterium]
MRNNQEESWGLLYGIAAYAAWGILPLYWKLLNAIPALEILAHRIFWSFIFVGTLLFFTNDWDKVKAVAGNRKNAVIIFFCSVIISVNWGVYIWAVNSQQVIEASMGYYINPLVVFLFSVVILKERLNRWQLLAIALAAVGVLNITIQYGKIPWIALSLALSFALYGLLKKLLKVEAMVGLALETALIAPLACGYILLKQVQGTGAVGSIPFVTLVVLIGAGAATATPLLWFAQAARRIKFSTMGFLQYIAPTITLFLGVIVFKEPFSSTHLLSFSFIWLALIIYSGANVGLLRKKLRDGSIPDNVQKEKM